MLTFSYEAQINDQNLFDEISDLFDQNFAGVLKRYTDTIFQKEQEIAKNVQLLGEYKKAIDESAIVWSKIRSSIREAAFRTSLTRSCRHNFV